MMQLLKHQDLSKLVAANIASQIQQLVNDYLQPHAVDFFTYARIFADGTRICLTNNLQWFRAFHANETYYAAGITSKPCSYYRSGYDLWSSSANPMQLILREQCGIDYGLTLINQRENYCELGVFATTQKQPAVLNFYINHLDFLKNYLQLFQRTLNQQLQKAEAIDRQILPKSIADSTSTISTKEAPTAAQKHYFIGGYPEEIYLTPMEVMCIQCLIDGHSAKSTAKILDISFRTVEGHLERIKNKLGCHSKAQLVKVVLLRGIY